MIPIFDIKLSKNSKKLVNNCLKNNWISSQGNYVKKFEKIISDFHKLKYCLVTSSCTSALHLSLRALSFKKGDEILCPALSFISPANMILLESLKLKLIDIDEDTMTINPELIEKQITKKTKGIMIVHQFSHVADMGKIIKISKKYNLKIIEDNAEGLGGKYKKKLNGTFGDISTLSFFANKVITTGEGGAILTNNKNIYKKCLLLRDHGMSREKKYHHKYLGFNYRMTNIQAAIGYEQFKKINKIFKFRSDQMKIYYNELKNVKEVSLRKFKNWCTPVHWLMTISCNQEKNRTKLMKFLKDKNIETRQMVFPINFASHIHDKKRYKVAEKVSLSSLHLPSGYTLKTKEIKYICTQIRHFFNKK